MAWDAGTITNAAPWATLSGKLQALCGTTGVENWSYVENVPAGTSQGQSGSASYSLDVFRCRGATNLYNRALQINLANSQITTDGSSFVHTITTPSTNQFITVCIINSKASAADDPTSVSLDGSNAPTFTKIKSQASGGASTILKMTLWIGKTGGSAPTGTQLTVSFGATQTGCIAIVDQWAGCDLTLSANNVDATGATQIGIQVVGNNGTNQTTHSATLATMLGPQSIAVTWTSQTASTGTYTPEAGWTGLAAELTMSTPVVHARGMFRPYQDDLTGVMTLSSATSETDWSCIALEFQRTTASTSVTSANDAGVDWYFVIEIPATDGAVNSSFNSAQDYDGYHLFNRMPPAGGTGLIPVGSGGWRTDTLAPYGGTINGNTLITGNNRGSTTHQILNTSGFNYWIKLTKNAVTISTRVSASEAMSGATLLDSFVTNATDNIPLINISNVAAGNTFSCIPGATGTSLGTSAFTCYTQGWTTPMQEGFTTNSAGSQDLWASQKVHVSRIFVAHSPGRSTTLATTNGYARGLWKSDFLAIQRGGTVQLGDTMTISGNTWTVISNSANAFGSGQTLIVLTRAN